MQWAQKDGGTSSRQYVDGFFVLQTKDIAMLQSAVFFAFHIKLTSCSLTFRFEPNG